MPIKPSSKEEEYLIQQELERRRRAAQESEAKTAQEERLRLKELHWMHCPKCGQSMKEISFRGVNIDQCPACQGVYLDAGELEQLAQADTQGGLLGSLGRLFKP